jgi:hypothetical protein
VGLTPAAPGLWPSASGGPDRRATRTSGQLAVPSRLVGEAVQDHDGPLVGDDLDSQPGRAVGQEHVAGDHEPKGTNRFLSAS